MLSHSIRPKSLVFSLLFERWRQKVVITIVSFLSAVFGVFAPFVQKQFSDGLLAGEEKLIFAFIAFGFMLLTYAFGQLSIWLAVNESLISQKALGDAAYERMLGGVGGLIGNRPAGEAVSLFAVDVPGATSLLDQALVMGLSMIFPLVLTPLALYYYFSISISVSIIIILGLCSINFLLAYRQSNFFYRFKQFAAERTGRVAEWIQNIRTLRILNWIASTEDSIFEVRRRETANRKAMVTNGQLMNSIAGSSTYLLNILAVTYLVYYRAPSVGQPKPTEILSLLWLLGVFLARPVRQMPWVLVIVLDAYSSIRRLAQAFDRPLYSPVVYSVEPKIEKMEPSVLAIRDLNFSANGKALLKHIDLTIKKGELIGVIGEVGSGKSLLIGSIVGSVGASFEQYLFNQEVTSGPLDSRVRGRIAYVPQDGFTMSASLLENIQLQYQDFVQPTPQETHKLKAINALQFAQFNLELERVNNGLETEIGERGVNLSGGQRQRVSIARAQFANCDLILLDDCLSAVDVDTERSLLEQLLLGDWKEKARILVTHRLSVLPHCNQILFMKEGRIWVAGTYDQLLANSTDFSNFIKRESDVNELEYFGAKEALRVYE